MIHRIWHGWTTRTNANSYEVFLRDEVFVGVKNRGIAGLHNVQLLRRDLPEEAEFIVVMIFDTLASVKAFAGEDYEAAFIPEKARRFLSRFDTRAQHYEGRISVAFSAA